MAIDSKLIEMYGIKMSIDTSGGTSESYAEIGDGIENMAEALNEVVNQFYFLSNQGFARNRVTGMAPTVTLTGRRVIGDEAQDYIFSKKFGLGDERESKIKIEIPKGENNEVITCPCTIANIQEFSGNTTDNSAISFELRFNGKPEVTTSPAG